MEVSAIDQLIQDSATRNTSTLSVANSNDSLGKSDFLRLLTEQLKQQNPFEPLKNEDFIAQMATFSSLEQMQNLNGNFEKFMGLSNRSSAMNLLGTKVSVLNGTSGAIEEGEVDAVRFEGGTAFFNVNGAEYEIGNIVEARK